MTRLSAAPDPIGTLLTADWFIHGVHDLAEQLGRDYPAVRAEVTGYLGEMSATHDDLAVRGWSRFGGWITRAYDIVTDDAEWRRLRELDSAHPLVLLPAHRIWTPGFSAQHLRPKGFHLSSRWAARI